MFSYRFFIKQAWRIAKQYRQLWFFGLFASLIAAGGEYQIITQGGNNELGGSFLSNGTILLYSIFNSNFWQGVSSVWAENPAAIWSLAGVILLAICLAGIMIYLAVISQAALVEKIARIIISKKKKEEIDIQNSMLEARPHFWRVFSLNLISRLIISVCFFIASIPLILMIISDSGALAFSYALLFVIMVPLSLSIAFAMKYAIAFQVLENRTFYASIRKGWEMFKNNWLVSLEMSVALFLINFLIGIVTIALIFLFFVPLLIISLQTYSPMLTATSLILSLLSMMIVASILTVFQTGAWTGLFIHLQEKRGLSKLERIFKRKR